VVDFDGVLLDSHPAAGDQFGDDRRGVAVSAGLGLDTTQATPKSPERNRVGTSDGSGEQFERLLRLQRFRHRA